MADPKKSQAMRALSLAWELGYSITIPLVVLALLGRFLDKKFGTSPWLLIIGIVGALIVSSIWVAVKAIKIMNEAVNENKSDKTRK